MRLRNIPGADEAVSNSPWVIQDAETKKGKWSEVFGKNQPLYIEVGMGKGQFITELSRRNPEINYIGIERYTSVLYRALQKRELLTEECGEEFPQPPLSLRGCQGPSQLLWKRRGGPDLS